MTQKGDISKYLVSVIYRHPVVHHGLKWKIFNNVFQIISKVSAEECQKSSNMMNVKLLDEIISDSEAAEDDQEISMDEEENFLVVDENSDTSLSSVND